MWLIIPPYVYLKWDNREIEIVPEPVVTSRSCTCDSYCVTEFPITCNIPLLHCRLGWYEANQASAESVDIVKAMKYHNVLL